jgi:RNA polymerase sigma-70 factor (ECF subfamily)
VTTHVRPSEHARDRDRRPDDASPLRPPSEEFVQQFTIHQRRLYLLILSQTGNTQDAEEILQETNLIIWSKYHQFDIATNFFAWAAQIATYEILKHRQRQRRDKLRFSDQFVDAVSREVLEWSDEFERRRTALDVCLQKLRPADRILIQERYRPGNRGKHVAEDLGRPANSVYQSLGRIRRTLLECIQRRLAAEVLP